MSPVIRVLVLGDIVGQAGLRALYVGLSDLVREYRSDLVIANAENAADGFGLTPQIVGELAKSGVDVVTTGNHIWQRREILPFLEGNPNVLRPANYPGDPPGAGWCVTEARRTPVGVLNLQGRVRLATVDCPFACAQRLIGAISRKSRIIIVDFHAEDTEEKEALAVYLDGKVSVVFGTHTHVQTADERILDGGTAYITDVGMTGPYDGVIGFDATTAKDRMISQMPLKMIVSEAPAAIRGICVEIETETGNATSIERVERLPVT
jgi:metallophosphoesterase (TIGR00282 family)